MTQKKRYIKPEIVRIELDKTIVLMQMTVGPPPNPPPRGGKGIDKKGLDEPAFKSPFGDKPFG